MLNLPPPQPASSTNAPDSSDRQALRAGAPSAGQLAELERLLSLCEVQAVRSGVPFPLGAHSRGNGVNFEIFSRHASGVRLDLFVHLDAAMPARSILLNSARNKTGDIWHVWLEWVQPGQHYGFRVAGLNGIFSVRPRYVPGKLTFALG